MVDLKHRIKWYIRKHGLIQPGDHVLTGLSGGADSVALLRILESLREELCFTLEAVHIHHGIRGAEADRDADFVERLCHSIGIPCEVCRYDVPALSLKWKISAEETGRRVRYEEFSRRIQDHPHGRIAVAHHMDDQAETVLMNLCRGSGIRGIGGMAPMSGRIIRPLLSVRRREIVEYLRELGQEWMEDSTNGEDTYTRNRLRNQILPELSEAVNQKTVEHIFAAAEQAREVDRWLEEIAEDWIQRRVDCAHGIWEFSAVEFRSLPGPAGRRVLLRILEAAAGSAKDLGSLHLEALEQLALQDRGGTVDLPYGLQARRVGSGIRIGKRDSKSVEESAWKVLPKSDPEGISLTTGMDSVCSGNLRITCTVIEPDAEKIPQKQYTKWFDYDKIEGTLRIRTRREEDAFRLTGGGHKSVRRYMIDAHIPAGIRERVPILADEKKVLWVIGGRMNAEYQVTDSTKRVLAVTVESIE